MDKKSKAQQRKKKSRQAVPRGMPVNEMVYKTSWTFPLLTSSTSGIIATGNISPSIVSSSEYSTVGSLFTEVRLLSCRVTFTGKAQSLTVAQGRVMVGTNMLFTYNTYSTPTTYTETQNLTRMKSVLSNDVTPTIYRMVVPKGLEYANIAGDSPSTPIPWAGSPGCVVVYGDGFTVSTVYFSVDVTAVYHLRGRQ